MSGAPGGHPPGVVVETHTATLAMLGGRVLKVKKPVDLGFLDFRTVAARRRACVSEVELNRRLAPDVYLGVVDLPGGDDLVAEPAVVMRRLPPQRRLAALVRAGRPVEEPLRALARLLAAFHAAAASTERISRAGRRETVRSNWAGVLERIAERGADGWAQSLQRAARLSTAYLDGRAPLFDDRIGRGRIRDGHGDLLAEDIFCLDDGPRVLDCIEFDPALRYGDVLADVAFLAMDLERLGAEAAAGQFLSWYREFSADTWPSSLADHYIAYRALVRCLVACVRERQGDQEAAGEAELLARLALAHLDRARVRLVLVGGLPGTGKTTLAAGIAQRFGWVHLRSDVIRKQLLGLEADQSAARAPGAYGREATTATYNTLLERARIALRRGESVVLDASWSTRSHRVQAARLAAETVTELTELRCVAPAAVAEQRLRHRAAAHTDASDATPAVAAAMAERVEDWPQANLIRTDHDRDAVLAAALDVIENQTP